MLQGHIYVLPYSVIKMKVFVEYIMTRDERVQHYLYLWRDLNRKCAGFNLEVGRVVMKWAGL